MRFRHKRRNPFLITGFALLAVLLGAFALGVPAAPGCGGPIHDGEDHAVIEQHVELDYPAEEKPDAGEPGVVSPGP